MRKKAKIISLICLVGANAIVGAVIATSVLNSGLKAFASDNTVWKHFAAVAQTDTERGVKEYWSLCNGAAPVFEQPIGSPIAEGTTDTSLFSDTDERWIPSNNEQVVIDMIDGLKSTSTLPEETNAELGARALYLETITNKRNELHVDEFIDSRTKVSYSEYKNEVDKYAVVLVSGSQYQTATEWGCLPSSSDPDFGTIYTNEVTDKSVQPQNIYVKGKPYDADCYATGIFAKSSNADILLNYYNDLGKLDTDHMVILNGQFIKDNWAFIEGGPTPVIETQETLSLFSMWKADQKFNGTYNFTSLVGFKKDVTHKKDKLSHFVINSDDKGWAEFSTKEYTKLHDRVYVADLTNATTVCWNNMVPVEYGKYTHVYFDLYNPTNSNISNVTFRSLTAGWSSVLESATKNLVPGWNRIMLPASMFEYSDINLFNMPLVDGMKTSGWKISYYLYGVKPMSESSIGLIQFYSQLTDWVPLVASDDPNYGKVYLFDTSGASAGYAFAWKGVDTISESAKSYDRVYFNIYNPTENTFSNVQFNTADSGWNTLTFTKINLVPGWSKVFLPRKMFEQNGGVKFSINVPAGDIGLWSGTWKIGGFIGVK